MTAKSVVEIAEGFGLTVEMVAMPENEQAFRIYKGAKQIFTGKEEAARVFLSDYERDRPGLFAGSMYGYKE